MRKSIILSTIILLFSLSLFNLKGNIFEKKLCHGFKYHKKYIPGSFSSPEFVDYWLDNESINCIKHSRNIRLII